ncbi:CheR family methyltransferase [Olivibacter sitiensis]|uniref:CheR family methyltransferase n=1 Tax=Olivibacter sitiensis TaxID=376470 RepID=UPI00040A8B14|nr:protein-glutamate O-methyltransferase CheR [Olivibacter sitiensis]
MEREIVGGLMVGDDQIELLLDDLFEIHGYDFHDYSRASFKRQINRLFQKGKFPSFAEFRFRLRTDKSFISYFLEKVTVNVTEMFRDPSFFKMLRESVLPTLNTYPFIRIWVAGCATGEEAYSLAILLKELKMLHKSLIYATDLNPVALESAKLGHIPLKYMKQYSENYIAAGGTDDFSSYYTASYYYVQINKDLLKNMVFSLHNLVSDHSFNEFQLILCRNVFIYFNSTLQDRVLNLFDNSLANLGYLALGSKETLQLSSISKKYRAISTNAKIWRKH